VNEFNHAKNSSRTGFDNSCLLIYFSLGGNSLISFSTSNNLLQYANPIEALESFRSSSFKHFKASSNLRLACALFENLDKAHYPRNMIIQEESLNAA